MKAYRNLVLGTALLTFSLIMLGAYVRLADAGLGCPDWPGCYGKLTPSHAAADIQAAIADQGGTHGPVSFPKAWKEMVHRYVAVVLGLLIIVIATIAVFRRRLVPTLTYGSGLPLGLFFAVCVQGALGAFTVTLLLKPAIVTLHLLGGMGILALMVWWYCRLGGLPTGKAAAINHLERPLVQKLSLWAKLAFVVVFAQIALGGWVSTNYAAVICTDFPTCQGKWWPAMEFDHAFHFIRKLGETPEGDILHISSLTAIHIVHRLGAVVVLLLVGGLGLMLLRASNLVAALRPWGVAVLCMLTLQILMGIGNVVFQLPLWLAVAHNGGAAVLLVVMLMLNIRLSRAKQLA